MDSLKLEWLAGVSDESTFSVNLHVDVICLIAYLHGCTYNLFFFFTPFHFLIMDVHSDCLSLSLHTHTATHTHSGSEYTGCPWRDR